MMDFLKEWEAKLGIRITCSQAGRPPAGSSAHVSKGCAAP